MHFTNTRSFSRILAAHWSLAQGCIHPPSLLNDTGAPGKGDFGRAGCGLYASAQWKIDSRSLR
jgi:hypothetical protein